MAARSRLAILRSAAIMIAVLAGSCHGQVFKLSYEYHKMQDGEAVKVNGAATAFAIDVPGDGTYLLTAAHSFDHTPTEWFLNSDTKTAKIKSSVVAIDRDLDLALLHTAEDLKKIKLAKHLPKLGEAVAIIGHYRGAAATSNSGRITNLYRGGFTVAAAFDHGGSGAPVLSGSRVVGVAVGINQIDRQRACCVPIAMALQFVAEHVKFKIKLEIDE